MICGSCWPLIWSTGDRFAGTMTGLSVLLVITMVFSLFRLLPSASEVRSS
jgi:hypothetical protein